MSDSAAPASAAVLARLRAMGKALHQARADFEGRVESIQAGNAAPDALRAAEVAYELLGDPSEAERLLIAQGVATALGDADRLDDPDGVGRQIGERLAGSRGLPGRPRISALLGEADREQRRSVVSDELTRKIAEQRRASIDREIRMVEAMEALAEAAERSDERQLEALTLARASLRWSRVAGVAGVIAIIATVAATSA